MDMLPFLQQPMDPIYWILGVHPFMNLFWNHLPPQLTFINGANAKIAVVKSTGKVTQKLM